MSKSVVALREEMNRKFVIFILLLFAFVLLGNEGFTQCSICTKTAQQLGEKPAKGLNAGILYLAATPYLIIGYIAYRWWKNYKKAKS
jgi:hypothetical protein